MIKNLLRPLLLILFRIKIQGVIPSLGDKSVIVANHQSFLDGLILWLVLPFHPLFIVNTEIAKRPLIRLLLSLSDYRVVDPANPMAIKTIIRFVEAGRPVVIFPEGRITTTGSLMKIYEGSAFVAAKTQATVFPVVIEGATYSPLSRMPQTHPRRWIPRITVTFGDPTTLLVASPSDAHDLRRKAADALQSLMQHNLFLSRQPQTLFDALLTAAEEFGPSRRVVEDITLRVSSYNDLITASLALGKLTETFSRPGDAVGVLMPTVTTTASLIFGLSAYGRVPAMLNYSAGLEGITLACHTARITTIITSQKFLDQLKFGEKLKALEGINLITLESLKASMGWGTKLLIKAQATLAPLRVIYPQRYDDPAVILFTSGSEGKPKGVVLSHHAILSNITQLRSIADFRIDDTLLNALPIFHCFGLTAGTLLPILSGMNLFLYPSPLHYRVIPEIVYDRSCTILLGTNTFLSHYGKHAHPYDFYRLRYVIAGAEKLTQAVQELWFEKFGIRIFEGYGATETAPVIAVNTPLAYRKGSVGKLLPCIQSHLEPIEGISEGGRLFVKGPNVMSGYLLYDHPGVLQRPCASIGEGWYDTGDIVSIDHDGYVKILGRAKRFAKIAGEMVSLESVEKVASLASPAHLHAATTKADPARGEMVILVTTDESLQRSHLVAKVQETGLPELIIPKMIIYRPTIPLLGTGKTDYVTLKSMVETV